ncbi:MAG TPA: LytR C-terminal domain-containing protein [Acidimicrobiales bacterium]|nr:LytR C-terminal domain-containing protein [Acidimicrobiales bacterium]
MRAGFVLALFVVATVLLLATIHTSGPAVVSAAVTTSTTSKSTTSKPTKSTTAHSRAGRHHTSTTTTTRPPVNVPVLVANGAGVNGAAAAFSARLQAAGWTTLTPTNATIDVPTSHVYYVAGQEPAAAAVAVQLGLPPTSVAPYTTAAPVSSIGTADVIVVLGPDLATPATVSTAPTTTTTTAASTTG